MLKRLELVGFKSFADKTQFDFGQGVTAIVGPNGSGKSNIVDAVRWILGEQSAKSLRGGEMADVIFNGSTSRRSLGLAEVTMTFDNSRRLLATEADEVQITRRVYRSGEGEYLINHQICRLRDIKELFLGSGAGADAYCIIEQGRVDVLLQSSTKERRTIFEEAAGISRFKAKKIETQRKLERVDLNLQRLRDIIEEVAKQLRSVKLQAAKAQRYQEYSGRLKELRLALGFEEYRQLSEQLAAETAILDQLRAALQEQAAQAAGWEADTRRLEEAIANLDAAAHEHEGRLAAAREHIAAEDATLTHERALSTELETDLTATRARMTELNALVAALADSAARTAAEVRGAEDQVREQRSSADSLEIELQAAVQRLAELQTQVQRDKADHYELMRQAGNLHNEAVSYRAQADNLARERERLRHKTAQDAEHLAKIDLDLQEFNQADEGLQGRLAGARQGLADSLQVRERLQHAQQETQQLVADLRAERSGLVSRIEVLEGLERSHEGLGTGVREVIALCEQPEPGPWRTVVGMIADVLTVRREYAPLIDLALGEWSQRFLVRDVNLLTEALRQRGQPLSGRVSFVPLRTPNRILRSPLEGDGLGVSGDIAEIPPPDAVPPSPGGERGELAHHGVVAAADQLVTCDNPELVALPAQLLARTLIVQDLAAAREIAARSAGYRLITLHGEMLDADGSLTVGTHHAEAGILSRKSELRDLRLQVVALDHRTADAERELAELRDKAAALDGRLSSAREEIDVLAEQATDLRARIGQHRQRREALHEEVELHRVEISGLEREVLTQEENWQRAKSQAEAADRQVHALEARLKEADRETHEREQQRQQRQQEFTLAKVALAKVEERWAALEAKHRQSQDDLDRRRQERAQAEQRLTGSRLRLEQSQRTMLHASSALAHGYLDKEAAERRVAELAREREQLHRERQLLAERAQASRNEWQARQEQAHARELETNDLGHKRNALVERLREDYQVDLAELFQQRSTQRAPGAPEDESAPAAAPAAQAVDSAAANEEIAELRRKLSRLGSVNLDSLQELAELENRATVLQTQYDDLTAAKRALEEIINAINQDSRRLFADTFASIRTHFQELFRKLFGGGMADTVLEDETDILESGIEIIARPPGKELRSISLMSGGEKTLTAVALLLAIFRSKPSPFCILDEVDAALDEANIGRYTVVLREFLDRSQFIIITHSKKTMASADVLYGITMQESGVSKRVSIRFEDWQEEQPAAAEQAPASANGNGDTRQDLLNPEVEAAGKESKPAATDHVPT